MDFPEYKQAGSVAVIETYLPANIQLEVANDRT
jgi:hypothetical protein